MRLAGVSGLRGSGKTTLIRTLIERMGANGSRCAVIVNEEGSAVYDETFVQLHQVSVAYLRGG